MTTATPTTERRVAHRPIQIRDASGGPGVISGTAIVYGQSTLIGGDFHEVIAAGAAREALTQASRLLLVWGHDINEPLARRGVTMKVWEDKAGVHFQASLPDTTRGRDVAELVRSGLVGGCSFAFTIDRDTWTRTPAGDPLRRVDRIGQLFELTVTPMPAYEQTSVSARARSRAAEIRSNLTAVTSTRTATRRPAPDRDPYADGTRSYFEDLIVAHIGQQQADRMSTHPGSRGRFIPQPVIIGRRHIDPADAQRRILQSHTAATLRDITTTSMGAAVPAFGLPASIEEAVGGAARSRTPLAQRLRPVPLPDQGTAVRVGSFTTGVSVTQQGSQNASVTEVDPVSTAVDVPVVTLAGFVDISRQALDRDELPTDDVIARELGAAFGASLDLYVVTTLLALSGITTVTYTDATPTVPELLPKVHAALAAVGSAGVPADTVAMHPRRAEWIWAAVDTGSAPIVPNFADLIIPTPAMPQTLGAGSEDAILALAGDEVPLAVQERGVQTYQAPGSGTLTVRIQLTAYACLLGPRAPHSVALVTGTGLAGAATVI